MYSLEDRDKFFNNIIDNVKKSKRLIGTYLIGSSSIGFRDIYSDCDFMMAYKKNAKVEDVRKEILSFFNKKDIGYIMERKWSDTIWGVSIYMKNGLSSDISFGPLDELKIRSNQIAVGVDTKNMLKKHMEEYVKSVKPKELDLDNIGWNFMYLLRKISIALERKNNVYAYQLLNDARLEVMNLEGHHEKMKMHEFKAYNELDKNFLKKINKTIPRNTSSREIKRCSKALLNIFNSLPFKFDKNLSYLLFL